MKGRSYLWFIALVFAAISFAPGASAKTLKWGGRAWTLAIDGEEAWLQGMRENWYLPWCFEGLRGKTAAKRLEVKLHVDARGEVQATGETLTTDPEDHTLLSCLDASWKAMPPAKTSGSCHLVFTFTKARR